MIFKYLFLFHPDGDWKLIQSDRQFPISFLLPTESETKTIGIWVSINEN